MANDEDLRILDVTCGCRSIWFDKNEPHTTYCDCRSEYFESDYGSHRVIDISPDVIADFRDLPFEDGTFNLVVADPPHIKKRHPTETGWMVKKYGQLYDGWEQVLHDGFQEWMRVLKVGGCSSSSGPTRTFHRAMFGRRSGRSLCSAITAERG